ncbi:hypothetical protein MYSEV_023 [Mythimna separata entomopoxvirus 'L']|uniref:Uncharacterized protein n=1 Tax=Mythimna separata entomopoxvirus 'L' TaxID=1293572 RepID=A0A916KPZ6_9POXV|nr:hypothetical protein MYSEV_023 [Mythimna separata entomopoxvirus 'L']CCU56221.1 hypothetical protein MYSEV_023 [Mythimna separata entomopoxvirus 'L']
MIMFKPLFFIIIFIKSVVTCYGYIPYTKEDSINDQMYWYNNNCDKLYKYQEKKWNYIIRKNVYFISE